MIKVCANTKKMILSGSRRSYKSEGFIYATRKIMAVDTYLSRIAEAIFYAGFYPEHGKSYSISTEGGEFTVYFCAKDDGRLTFSDIVFYRFLSSLKSEGGFDRSLSEFILSHPVFDLTIDLSEQAFTEEDAKKVYLIADGDGFVNFPLLSPEQKKIVETENANVLVQGVAGSGKTNVCIEKIVYCACRNYRGRVLYTTFSRGLLSETEGRVNLFVKNIEKFIEFYRKGSVVFIDDKHRCAIENKLGILFDTDDDGKIVNSLENIATFLKNNVDYMLIEDIYAQSFERKKTFGEREFLSEYAGDKSFRLSGALEKIKHIAPELIYKEIYGMIYGKYSPTSPADMMERNAYAEERAESFTRFECDTIYTVATDLAAYMKKNGYTDNNLMSRELIKKHSSPLYSVAIIDEAQDFTQVNLYLVKKLARKLFCVGDALQMINPAYFSFGYLKSLMYGDITSVCELTHNYRSTQKIEDICEHLGELNKKRFGTHSFVLKGQSVSSPASSSAVFVRERDFAELLNDKRFENITLIVSSVKKKEQLKRKLAKVEILTVAEAKGLERNTVLLCDVLSDSADKWKYLENLSLNRKTADENSVFRYYFNLFYVGVSRARQHLFVSEYDVPESFKELFKTAFDTVGRNEALSRLKEAAGKIELDDEEIVDRIEKFCSLEQYDNARFAADRLSTDELRDEYIAYIFVHEKYLKYSKWREAGMEYWRRGLDGRAREMFTRSGDEKLFPLMDACKKGGGALDADIVRFYPMVADNELAKNIILDTLNSDVENLQNNQREITRTLKGKRR